MEFLTTKGIAASIENIIRYAKDFIIIISPYVKIDKTYIERLHEAERNYVKIDLIFGKQDMNDFEREKFNDFHNINIYFLENLHAKCYMNEKTALVTSMNLYGYSEENNREMGIEICKDYNYDLYEDIKNEAFSIKCVSEGYYNTSNCNVDGYCIRCGEKIDFNKDKPLCIQCYHSWVQFENVDYTETYCHACGKIIDPYNEHHQIDYLHPLCFDCWKANRKPFGGGG